MSLKIDILVNDGSSIGVVPSDIWGAGNRGIGVGGSELAILTLCEEWTKVGYDVTLFNNPCGELGSFRQEHTHKFDPNADRDVVIAFRTPNEKVVGAKGLKVWLSYDQFTLRDRPFDKFAPKVDKIVGISEFHSDHFKSTYNIHNMIVIDLPLRTADYRGDFTKVKNRLMYTSVPGRGLMNLHAVWPTLKKEIPDASLSITSDYRLWGVSSPNNQQFLIHFMPFINSGDVRFLGALSRDEYLLELSKAQILAYPHKDVNPELFCISVMEAQYAGVYPVTSDCGALKTTNMGTVIPGDAESVTFRHKFVDKIVELLSDEDLLDVLQSDLARKIYDRCKPESILQQWEEKVFNEG